MSLKNITQTRVKIMAKYLNKGQKNDRTTSRDIRQKKSLGQVFLNTSWPVDFMVNRLREWGIEKVIEIGPGDGMLTRGLLGAGMKVTAIEKDDRFAERLRDNVGPELQTRLVIENCDVLAFDLEAWLGAQSQSKTAIVGNIPYNISTPILLWLLPGLTRVHGAMLMVQLEFAERLAAEPDCKDYGSISVFAQLRAKINLETKVEKNCFTPVPKVDSAILSFMGREDLAAPEVLRKVEIITRAAFSQRRKKLRNGIKAFLKDRPESSSPIALERRPETLSVEDFLTLAGFLLG